MLAIAKSRPKPLQTRQSSLSALPRDANHTSSHFWFREKWVRCLKLSIVMSVTAAWAATRYFVCVLLKPGEIYELRTKVITTRPPDLHDQERQNRVDRGTIEPGRRRL